MKYVPAFGLKAQVFMLCVAPLFLFLVTPKDKLASAGPVLAVAFVVLAAAAWTTLVVTAHRIVVLDEHLVVYTAFRSRVVRIDDVSSIGPNWRPQSFRIALRDGPSIRGHCRNGYAAFAEDLTTRHPSIEFRWPTLKPKTDQFMESGYSELTEDERREAEALVLAAQSAAS
ncbi:hypothetical protein [Plantibacter cousiniae (nom. nud.)]|uniref:PH domain-containing protein n=1 Tax=Plantibacter cousiniae (nom. nud.) TaxID=199709 RepID=A0ABY1LG64_9MICO|nr:hypothetical protein [Plantibacter cousiniae]SKC37129.1 hypothetical protein SAMN06295973_0238 [Plantibacter cousiniae]